MQFPQERLTTALTTQYPPVVPPLPTSQSLNSCSSFQSLPRSAVPFPALTSQPSPSTASSCIPHSQKTDLCTRSPLLPALLAQPGVLAPRLCPWLSSCSPSPPLTGPSPRLSKGTRACPGQASHQSDLQTDMLLLFFII